MKETYPCFLNTQARQLCSLAKLTYEAPSRFFISRDFLSLFRIQRHKLLHMKLNFHHSFQVDCVTKLNLHVICTYLFYLRREGVDWVRAPHYSAQ
jgi:hypothetical protein